jgi:hypothetical protein
MKNPISTKVPQLQSVFTAWLGLIQRIAIVPFMLWLFIFALELKRKNSHEPR